MGRWGHRLFESDQDIDLAIEISAALGKDGPDLLLSRMINQTDMLAPDPARWHYETAEYQQELAGLVASTRAQLDSGICDRLFDKLREEENKFNGYMADGKYSVVLMGALAMRAGARIRESDLRHIRKLVPQIACREGYAWPLADAGFRGPGRAQLLAALDHYEPGTPRNFQEPSCFYCGQVKGDIGKDLLRCGRCKEAWYCDRTCQRAHWQKHKPSCTDPNTRRTLNV